MLNQDFLQSVDDNSSSKAETACLLSLTGCAKTDGQKRPRISTFHTLVERYEASSTTWQERHFLYHCPVSANAIIKQLLRNGKYEGADCESTLLVSKKEVSDL